MRFLLVCLLALIATTVFAVPPEIPDVDPIAALVELVKNFKDLGTLPLAMSVIVIAVQVIKKYFINSKYAFLLVTVLSLAYGGAHAMVNGAGLSSALVLVLITQGGAIAIYEAIKALWKPVQAALK